MQLGDISGTGWSVKNEVQGCQRYITGFTSALVGERILGSSILPRGVGIFVKAYKSGADRGGPGGTSDGAPHQRGGGIRGPLWICPGILAHA